MASAGDSNDPTDINGVLENLGSLIGELDACVTETGGKVSTSSKPYFILSKIPCGQSYPQWSFRFN